MDYRRWNEVLGEAFLKEGPNRPVYFSVTEAELQRINDRRGLRLEDPVEDLRSALRPHSFLSIGALHRKWERSGTKDLPPWLPFLAATTIVVDQQSERGSTAFYSPLGQFLGRSKRITDDEYLGTFFVWWVALKRWLADQARHDGALGFATWGAIPSSGPRCIIGHPYTQVMLRREERRQIDNFLAEFDHLGAEPPTAVDREAVAHHLVRAFRRWARTGRSVGGRLRKILEGPDGNETLSLGYILLGRLFDDLSGEQRHESAARIVRIVPAYDDYDRALKLVAVAPNWVRTDQPVYVSHADDALRAPGDIVHLDLPITDDALVHGIELPEGSARLESRPRYVMAARQWDLWCCVDDLGPSEEVVTLLPAGEARRLDLPAVSGVFNLPDGWLVCGPFAANSVPAALRGALGTSGAQLVPQLRGGLQLERGVYIHGGEPELGLAGASSAVVDSMRCEGVEDVVDLAALALEPGHHRIDVDGFQFNFESIRSTATVDVQPTLGRAASGEVVSVGDGAELVTGARLYPTERRPSHSGLIPWVGRFVKLGAPGEVGIVEPPQYAPWAARSGLPHVAVELQALSTHPDNDRLIRVPRWVAWQSYKGWTVAEFRSDETARDDTATFIPKVWTQTCMEIGPNPQIRSFGTGAAPAAEVLARWRAYCESEVTP